MSREESELMTYRYDTPIRYVRGLGPIKARELTKIGINTVGDLLEHHPLSYIYPGGVSIAEAKEGRFDLLVIGAHVTPGISSLLVGDLSEQILLAADIPVLVVRQVKSGP